MSSQESTCHCHWQNNVAMSSGEARVLVLLVMSRFRAGDRQALRRRKAMPNTKGRRETWGKQGNGKTQEKTLGVKPRAVKYMGSIVDTE